LFAVLLPLIRVLSFLTRFPFKKNWFDQAPPSLAHDAVFLPVAGMVIGGFGAIIFYTSYLLGFSSLIASLLTVTSLVVITGALHEDGLADVADSFFADKGADRRLEIMKDSRCGVFGVFALIFSTGLRVTLLAEIADNSGVFSALFILVGIEGGSRAAMVVMWRSLPVALLDKTAQFAGQPDNKTTILSAMIGVMILVVCFSQPTLRFGALVCASILLVLSAILFRALCVKKIGGYCGDALGAMQQIGLLALLIGANSVF